jgi:hypothetical protein
MSRYFARSTMRASPDPKTTRLKVENAHPETTTDRGTRRPECKHLLKSAKIKKANGNEAVFHVQARTTNTNEAEDKIMNHKYRSACGSQEE